MHCLHLSGRFDRATALALARAPRFADAAVASVASMLARAATSSAAGGGGGAAAARAGNARDGELQ